MSFRGRTFASLFTQAAENATSSVKTVKGMNNSAVHVARSISSGKGVGNSSRCKSYLRKAQNGYRAIWRYSWRKNRLSLFS